MLSEHTLLPALNDTCTHNVVTQPKLLAAFTKNFS